MEEFPFGPETSVFKVLGKMFALTTLDARPLTVNLKCDPDDAVRLRERAPGADRPRLAHEQAALEHGDGRRRLPDRLVRELIEDSYDLVVAGLPKAERLKLDRP